MLLDIYTYTIKFPSSLPRQYAGLVSLGLADNLIGDEGAGALAELVRQSDTLETIILSGNDIGNEGGSIMIAALAQNTSLKALYMAGVRTLM